MSIIEVKQVIATRAPEYNAYEGLDDFIIMADSMTGEFSIEPIAETSLVTPRDIAVALRTLHMICRRENRDGAKDNSGQGIGGMIGGESEGQLSIKYRTAPQYSRKYPDLMLTTWGTELIGMIQVYYGITALTRNF